MLECGFYGIEEEATGDISVFNGDMRPLVNGVAILRPSDEATNIGKSGLTIDEKGYFIEPTAATGELIDIGLEAFFPEAENYADNVEDIEVGRKQLLDSLYFLKNYNYVLQRIAEIYDVPSVLAFQIEHLQQMYDRIDALNSLFMLLYDRIRNNEYTDKETQAKKLQVLQDLFSELDYKALELPEENKNKVEELLQDFQAFKGDTAEEFYFLLYSRPTGQGEGVNI